jgi:chaperonin GroEL
MKIIKTGKEARTLLKRGIDVVADAVAKTLGPSGRNAIIGRKFQAPLTTNDGVSVAKAISLEDEVEELGAQIVKEVGTLTDNSVGDGTTTSIVLLQAIMSEGFSRLTDEGSLIKRIVDPIQIKREIDAACELIVSELKKSARPISTKEDIESVAFVSVENREIAKIIADLFDKIGKDGVIRVEEGAFEIESDVVQGMEIGVGYSSQYMSNNDKKELVLNNVKLLVTNIPLDTPTKFTPLMESMFNEKQRELIIISEDVTKPIQQAFVGTKLKGDFIVHAIKPPFAVLSDRLEDVAVKFGAVFIDKDKGMKLEETNIGQLGVVKKLVATKDKTILFGGDGKVDIRIANLREEMNKTVSVFDKKKIEERIASLSGGIGIIRVGAQSDSEKEYWRLKVVDCVGATKAALDEGVVKGGGLALKEIAERLPVNILTESIKKPYQQIMENAGIDLVITDDIIDPVKVTRSALQNACSVAGTILTAEIAIADANDDEHTKQDK